LREESWDEVVGGYVSFTRAKGEQSSAHPYHAVRKALRLSVWDGIFSNLYGNLTGGVFLVGYMLALGASETQVGLLSGLPLVANVIQLVSTYLIELAGRRRPLALASGACARLLWLVVIGASFSSLTHESLLFLSLLVVAFSQIGTAINNLAWVSWMADLVREDIRGRYFSLRNSLLSGSALLATWGGEQFLDRWKATHAHGELSGFRVLFSLAVVCGVIGLIIQSRITEPPLREGKDAQAFRIRLFLPFQDEIFRRLLLFITVWNVGVYLSGPFFAVYMLQHLHLDYSMIVSYVVLSSVVDLFSVRIWGWVSDRTTNKTVLFLCSFFVALIPFGWLFASRENTALIAMLHIQGGLFWSGIHLCTANLVLKITPESQRSLYYATFNSVAGIVAVITPIIGGVLLQHIPKGLEQLSFGWGVFALLFLLSGLLRLLGLPLLMQISEPQGSSPWEAVRVIRNVRAFTTTMGFNQLYHFWLRARRWRH
jgi:Na+/melibiose symporter-like transporter